MIQKNIVIYGAGNYGENLEVFLSERDIQIECFCQTEPTEKKIRGKAVVSFSQLLSLYPTDEIDVVLIAIENKEISSQLKRKIMIELPDCEVYECGQFIKENIIKSDYPHVCLCCNEKITKFEKGGIDVELFRKHSIIGGGYRSNCVCPHCGANDRYRWLTYVLEKYTVVCTSAAKVLHFAPEESIASMIKQNKKCDYYSADIEQGKAMHIVDITEICFGNACFDYIICNHVLEHIKDEKKAIYEMKRVLKDDGSIILSFPICLDMTTIEEENANTPEERLKLYGQEDHVRLYGKDYKERLERYGLTVSVKSPILELPKELIYKYGFIENDITLICKKI